jgi:hypothetical protein
MGRSPSLIVLKSLKFSRLRGYTRGAAREEGLVTEVELFKRVATETVWLRVYDEIMHQHANKANVRLPRENKQLTDGDFRRFLFRD